MESTLHDELNKQCEVCLSNPHKYCCPKCGTKTCSLECVKQHKQRSQCDGVVDHTTYVPKSDFHEDEHLVQRDYNFLSHLNRTISVQKEDVRSKNKRILNPRAGPPQHNSYNYNRNHDYQNKKHQPTSVNDQDKPQFAEIVKRGVNIRQLPRGMERSVINKSTFDKKLNTFLWTIEYILINPDTGEELQRQTKHRITEETRVKDTVPHKILEQVRECSNDEDKERKREVFLFLKLIDKPASSPEFILLDNEKMIGEVLKGQTVIEFPTFIVSTQEVVKGYKVFEEAESSDSDSDSESDSDTSSDSDSESGSDSDESDDDNDDDHNNLPEEQSSKVVVPPLNSITEKPLIEVISTENNIVENVEDNKH